MELKTDRDINLSHSIINFVHAAYQGRFAFLNILSQLDSPRLQADELNQTREGLNKINHWLGDLWKAECLFSASWQKLESFDAKRAFEMLEAIKMEMVALIPEIARPLERKDFSTLTREEIELLIASYGRYSYARDNYIRGFIEFGKKFEQPELVNQYSSFLRNAEADVQRTHSLLKVFRESETLDAIFYQTLINYTLPLPGVFNTQLHDTNQLLAIFKGGLSYQMTGISPKDIPEWENLGVGPVEAGYWAAFGIGPEEAAVWAQSGFIEASEVGKWKTRGFGPDSGKPWHDLGIASDVALLWAGNQFEPEDTRAYLERGFTHPAQARLELEGKEFEQD